MVFLHVQKILIVSATKSEMAPLLTHLKMTIREEEGMFVASSHPNISILITGVGMVNTAYYLGRYSTTSYDYCINVGICGAFNKNLTLGEVVCVSPDTLSEMGAENDSEFIHYSDLNLGGTTVYFQEINKELYSVNELKQVKGITVNTVHGNERTIEKTIELFNPDIESMEGAAFLRAAKGLAKNYFQIRAVSNYVEKRDKGKWKISLAVSNLNITLLQIINSIQSAS